MSKLLAREWKRYQKWWHESALIQSVPAGASQPAIVLQTDCRRKRQAGTTIAEMPVALWIIVLICFCLLILATEMIRFGFFWNACREAAQRAAQCQTFQNDSSVGLSSVTTANSMAQQATNSFSGITLTSVNTYILETNVISGTTTKYPANVKLSNAADTAANIYDIQVELSGQIDPLIAGNMGLFANVPGLTGPYPVVVRTQFTSEVPQGLNQ